MSVDFLQLDPKSTVPADNKDFLDVYGVRITPPFLEFKHAFEGRTYKQKLSIRNISKSKVFIRIKSPTSFAFKIKCGRGYNLSPGLCMVKEVSYIYTHANIVPSCILTICINENHYDYQMFAVVSAPKITITPKKIEFGLIDAGFTSAMRKIVIQNDGTKAARFYIDCTRTEHQIIIDPNKGLLKPKSSSTINVKLISSIVGNLEAELWIKCDKPFIIPVTAEVIKPKFEPVDVGVASSFNLVDFPITYIGLTSTKTVYVRNYSATEAMFCLMGEIKNKIMNLKVCEEIEPEFKHFDAYPKDGIYESKQVKALHFKFQPVKPKSHEKLKRFYFCIYHICRIRCKYLTPSEYGDIFAIDDDSNSLENMPLRNPSILLEQYNDGEAPVIDNSYLLKMSTKQADECDCVKFYLHGIAEEPSVNIVPNALSLSDLQVGQKGARVLELQNKSETLPIIIAYKKVAYVDIERNNILLKPGTSAQIAVYITPQKIGLVNIQMQFDLMFYDYPKTANSCKVIGKRIVPVAIDAKSHKNSSQEAGKFCEGLKFNSPVEKPKSAVVLPRISTNVNGATVALPNDTRRSIRPWREKTIPRTIFTNIPRYVPPTDTDYEHTVFDQLFKMKVKQYYMLYTRRKAERLRSLMKPPEKTMSDYDLTNQDKLLCNDIHLRNPKHSPFEEHSKGEYFIPLTPMEMSFIVVDPELVHTGPMAPHSRFHFTVNIKNKNSFSIRVFLRSENNNVMFAEGSRRVIKGFTESSLPVIYTSPSIGYYTASLDVIVNECAVYAVALFADVYPVTLRLDHDQIEFSNENTNQYVEIMNPLNINTSFKWLAECKNFHIDPWEGTVPAKSSLMCSIAYLPRVEGPSLIELDLFADDRHVQQVRLIVVCTNAKLHFVQKELVFEDMPLNIPVVQKAVLRNSFKYPQFFFLMENKFSKFVQVFPSEGIVYGNSCTPITIIITLTNCVTFETKLKFDVTKAGVIQLLLRGNVVYPEVVVKPSFIHFKKVPSSTFEVMRFTVENRSKAKAIVRFDMSMYSEYRITEHNNYWEANIIEKVVLEKQDSKQLFIHFLPTDLACDQFFLPIIINDILGPVICENVTGKVAHFLTDVIPDSKMVKVPTSLPGIKVQSHAIEPKLSFSKFRINLSFNYPPYRYRDTYNLKICNNQKEIDDVCIRTDDLAPPLQLTYLGGKEIVKHQNSIVCSLSPKEEVVLKILFEPKSIGIYQAVLPFYLRSDDSMQPHNYLTIRGTFASPTIASLTPIIYYKPIPLRVKAIRSIDLVLENHFRCCRIECHTKSPDMKVEVVDKRINFHSKEFVTLKLHYSSDKSVVLVSKLTVVCRCGVKCVIPLIGNAENCFLTNYAMVDTFITNPVYNLELRKISYNTMHTLSLMSMLDAAPPLIEEYDMSTFFKDYPLFPADDDGDVEFVDFMNTCVTVMESWVYTQGFFGRTFYKIPEGMSNVIVEKTPESRVFLVVPFVNLLVNLVGNNIENYFELSSVPSDKKERSVYYYEIYNKAMQFLASKGAQFSYENPMYLMEYSMYSTYVDHLSSEGEEVPIRVSNRAQFRRLSKQCWLDLLLQTFKVLILHRQIMAGKVCAFTKSKCQAHESYRSSVKNISRNNHIFNTTEALLLCWLEFQYNEVKSTFWSDNVHLQHRDITYFGENMVDGFVYAAVTLAYCPYLESHFKQLCQNPLDHEQIIHNNIKVIQAWNLLNFSIDVTVQELANPHSLRTLIITVYLFEVLPYMSSLDTLEFKVGLSEKITKQYVIKNKNHFSVAYKAILYENIRGCFETDKTLYVVPARKVCTVKITFWAKFIERCECTLILSGECKGHHYAKSQVIILSGEPDVTYMTTTIQHSLFLYTTQRRTLTINSPYMTKAAYKIQSTSKKCLSMASLDTVLYRENFPELSVFRYYPIQTEVECDGNGVGTIDGVFQALSPRKIPVLLYFRNRDVGDFGVRIITICKTSRSEEVLKVGVPKEDSNVDVKCRRVPTLYLEIPCQNKLLWKCIIQTFLMTSTEDMEFWKKHVYTTTGLHVLQRIIKLMSQPFDFIVCRPIVFNVKVPKNSNVKMPKTIEIEDECSSASIKVPLHFIDTKCRPKNFSIALESSDKLELRHYQVQFVYLEE